MRGWTGASLGVGSVLGLTLGMLLFFARSPDIEQIPDMTKRKLLDLGEATCNYAQEGGALDMVNSLAELISNLDCGCYIKDGQSLVMDYRRDSWGRQFFWKKSEDEGAIVIEIRSAGRNGAANDEDDIVLEIWQDIRLGKTTSRLLKP